MTELIGILGFFDLAAHVTAGLTYLILWGAIYEIQKLGVAAWAVPVLCLSLAAQDFSGRAKLSGSLGKTLAAFGLPVLCGCMDIVIREKLAPPVWGCFLSLLLLAGYILLRENYAEMQAVPLKRAEALLALGSSLGVVKIIWICLIGAAVFLMATFGFIFTVFIGIFIASANSLLDYGGVCGILLSILVLHLLQSMRFCQGTKLTREAAFELGSNIPFFILFIPVWNQIKVRRLAKQLQMRDVKDYY